MERGFDGSVKARFPSVQRAVTLGTPDIDERAIDYVNQVLRSQRLSYGPFTEGFERSIAQAHDAAYAVACNSGTDALRLALAASKERLGWTSGDEVLVPSLTFVATVNVVIQEGLSPVFVDIETETFGMDPGEIDGKITGRTRAVIPVHIAGHPCRIGEIVEVAQRRKLAVIEDCCEAMFATSHKKPVGSFGSFGCFSTYVAHTLVTGVGGLVVSTSPELEHVIRSLANHGRDPSYLSIDHDDNISDERFIDVVRARYRFQRVGYSVRMTELQAALGLAQFEKHREMLSRRRRNAEYLTSRLEGLETFHLPRDFAWGQHTYMFYPVLVRDPGVDRDALVIHLERHGIETRYLLPLISQPIYSQFGDLRAAHPRATEVLERGFYIGCHQGLRLEEMEYVASQIERFVWQARRSEVRPPSG